MFGVEAFRSLAPHRQIGLATVAVSPAAVLGAAGISTSDMHRFVKEWSDRVVSQRPLAGGARRWGR
jgi:hypothetical protein